MDMPTMHTFVSLITDLTKTSCEQGGLSVYREQLQHGHANFIVHAALLQQLALQAHRLPQVCVGLCQDVVDVQS